MSEPGTKSTSIAPDPSLASLLPGADFADAFRIVAPERLDAAAAAKRALESVPLWVRLLMGLRDLIVLPFGLITRYSRFSPETLRIGVFPIIETGPQRVVLGLDDRHLDFRVVIQTSHVGGGTVMILTTLVRTHGWPGRAYMRAILPFHGPIVRAFLSRAAQPV